MALKTISAHEDEDVAQILQDEWGRAFFTAKTKPKTAALIDRICGKITQPYTDEAGKNRRQTYWVVSKPNRQEGEKPKLKFTTTIDPDLLAAVDAYAESQRDYRSTVVEAALRCYLELAKAQSGVG